MKTSQLDYAFDPTLVATTPVHPRDDARLMVIDRRSGTITHRRVRDLTDLLVRGDTLLINRTSVLRARVHLRHEESGRTTEGLFLERVDETSAHGDPTRPRWRVLIRQAKRFSPGERLILLDERGEDTADSITLIERDDDAWIALVVAGVAGMDVATMLERSGRTPLPPYILKARKQSSLSVDDNADRREYETVYAQPVARESVAAPTAGLHFTDALLDSLLARGVSTSDLTLDVGAGTFKPIDSDDLTDHPMHRERFRIPPSTLQLLANSSASRARNESRLIAVGTTSVRACESLPAEFPPLDRAFEADTRLLIAPGYTFRFTDALLTNFHLPRSTLLALVGAFMGMELMHEAYACAVRERYRFYSYGDAMLIV